MYLKFRQFLEASEIQIDEIIPALRHLSTIHPLYKNNQLLQSILNEEKVDFSTFDLISIAEKVTQYLADIAKRCKNLTYEEKLLVIAEQNVLQASLTYLNAIIVNKFQKTLKRISEVDATRKFSRSE